MMKKEKFNIPFSPPDISQHEIDKVVDALKSGWITTGPKTKELENRIAAGLNLKKTACLNSATAAMELVLRILGIGEGDEVIVPAYTYTASASIVEHVGAKLILIDSGVNSFEMNYEELENLITNKTKMIVCVDIAGKMCDYRTVHEIVDSKKSIFTPNNDYQQQIGRVAIMADAAHSFGAIQDGIESGLAADFTCFSFHAVKNLTTAEGGAVVWNPAIGFDDDQMYTNFMLYSLHGQSKDALSKSIIGSWEYDIIYPAYKCNMTDILASLGLAQLDRYTELLSRRQEIVKMYDSLLNLNNISSIQHSGQNYSSSFHLYLTRVNGIDETGRNAIITELAKQGISTNVHYKPLPMFTAYKRMGFDINDFPNAYQLYQNEITLPLHTLLDDDQVAYICRTYNEIVQ